MKSIWEKLKLRLEQDKNLSYLISNSAIVLVIKIIGVLGSMAFIWIISNLFSAEALGVFVLGQTFLNSAVLFASAGLNISCMRFMSKFIGLNKPEIAKDVVYRTLSITIAISLTVTGVVYFSADLLAVYAFNKPEMGKSISMFALMIFPFALLHFFAEALKGAKLMWEFAFVKETARFVIGSALLGVLLLWVPQVDMIVELSFGIGIVFSVLWGAWQLMKKSNLYHITRNQDGITTKEIMLFAKEVFFAQSIRTLNPHITTLILGSFAVASDIGAYGIIVKVSLLTVLPMMATNAVVAPKLSEKNALNDHKGLGVIALQTTKMNFWLSLPIIGIIFIFPEFLLGIFNEAFTEQWVPLVIITGIQFINAISGPVGQILQMTDHERTYSRIVLATIAVNIILGLLLIPSYGVMGAVLSSGVSIVIHNLTAVFYIKKLLGITVIYIPLITK